MDFTDIAKKYISFGLSVLPINKQKQPLISSWVDFQKRLPNETEAQNIFRNADGIAVIAGRVSGCLEVIDIDCKYDLTGKMFLEFCACIKDHNAEILTKITTAKTVNGGFHFIYRLDSETVEGNQKLAQRPATKTEAEKGDKVKVLFETRGEGGYIAVAPTPGYEIKRRGFDSLEVLSMDERNLLFAIAKSFDQMPVEEFPEESEVKKQKPGGNGLSPFEEYNSLADIPTLLQRHGWKRIYQRGDRIHFKRPGQSESVVSANFDVRRRIFYVFSTSTEFESARGYNPTQVFTILECGRDYSKASNQLYSQGYGRQQRKPLEFMPRKKQESPLYQWLKKYQANKEEAA